MKQTISAGTARVGDHFEATLRKPVIVTNQVVLPEGSLVLGRVVSSTPHSANNAESRLEIAFYRIISVSREFAVQGFVDRVLAVTRNVAAPIEYCGTTYSSVPIEQPASPPCSMPASSPKKPAFSSPTPKDADLRRVTNGTTEFVSTRRNVSLKRGTLLAIRNVSP